MDIKKFTKVIGGLYLSSQEITKIYKGLTEALDLQEDPDWYDFCSRNDSRHCNEYLIASDLAALKTDGRLLKEYKPEDITLNLIDIAVKAHAPLTPSMIRGCSRIKYKLTNQFVFEKAKTKTFKNKIICNDDWLKCWDKKGPDFLKVSGIKKFKDLLDILNIEYYLSWLPRTNKNVMKYFDNLNLPKVFYDFLDTAKTMIYKYNEEYREYMDKVHKTYWSERDKVRRPFTVLSNDPKEQELFLANLKLAGLLKVNTTQNKDGSLGWNNDSCYLDALLYCLCSNYKLEEE